MTVENILEELRDGQAQDDDVLRKRFKSYRTKDVDQYIEKLRDKMRVMESVYQERFEEMRTNLLGLTRERDAQAERLSELQNKLNDMPKYCQAYLKEQGMVAVQTEKYELLSNFDLAEYEQLKEFKEKFKLIEQENKELLTELEKAGVTLKDAQDASVKLERISIQMQSQEEQIEQQKAQLQIQMEQSAQRQAQIETMEEQSRNQDIELAQLQSKHQILELQHKHALEMSQLLAREKESLEKESYKQKELWDTERDYLIQRFNGILNSQKQYMVHLKESITSSILHMEKMNDADFLVPNTDEQQDT